MCVHSCVCVCAVNTYKCLVSRSMRNEEIQSLSGVDEFGEFYRRLKHLKDYHRKFADDVRFSICIYTSGFIAKIGRGADVLGVQQDG